ncbi:MAG: hypothetical protein BWY32_03065 [bacterium ADurb.Bin243]|nr:MAG: hypothetical protein BWY32_03065 [bacterium ADurb.Bin243]
MAKKKESLGFGFVPEESQHHFLISVPEGVSSSVSIIERFNWAFDVEEQKINEKIDKRKVEISKSKWAKIKTVLKNEFNKRLKKAGLKIGDFKTGQTPVEKLFGKEILVLAWAIEDCEESVIPVAIENWLGLSPEERWWLYTMTNASTGEYNNKKGWRKALRYALTENPVLEIKQGDLFEHLLEARLNEIKNK